MKKISDILFYVFTPLLIGTIIGLIFKDYTSYIQTLNRNIKVPSLIFPIAWSILYLVIGIWYYFYQKNATDKNKLLYYILLVLNYLFTPLLFYFKQITLSLILVLLLIIGNAYLFYDFLKKDKKSYILIPYLIWLCFAQILMIDLFINNILN